MGQDQGRKPTTPKRGRGFSARPLTGTQRVWILNAALAAGAGILYLFFAGRADRFDPEFQVSWLVLTGLFALTEIYVVHIQFRRDSESFSLNEIPLVLGLFFSSPGELVVAQVLGAGLALFIRRRQSLLKLTFNLSHLGLEAVAASTVFHAVARLDSPLGAREIGAAFGATGL